jgi:ATP-dependent Zn protease
MALAGRAAEEIFFGRVTAETPTTWGVYGNRVQVRSIVRHEQSPGTALIPEDPYYHVGRSPYSEKTAKAMDEEARTIIDKPTD